ncbi:hypothetical protein M8818_007037 [Zalaria obscura]|uniref:Uncharacterized protein n=1 Tax=Zalaria obscura TaxID=2024903 RepID=A0ACC3S4F1_9PEZI
MLANANTSPTRKSCGGPSFILADVDSRRRFAQRNVIDMEPIIQEQVDVLIAKFDQFCSGPPAPGVVTPAKNEVYNVRWWFNLFSYDAIGAAAFGKPFGFLKQGSDRYQAETFEGHRYETDALGAFHDSSTYDSILAHWPQLLPIMRRLSKWHPGIVTIPKANPGQLCYGRYPLVIPDEMVSSQDLDGSAGSPGAAPASRPPR